MKYRVSAEVTISLHALIEAKSKKEAMTIARELSMPDISNSTGSNWDIYDPAEDFEQPETWSTSGELDGEAKGIEVEGAKP